MQDKFRKHLSEAYRSIYDIPSSTYQRMVSSAMRKGARVSEMDNGKWEAHIPGKKDKLFKKEDEAWLHIFNNMKGI